MQIRFAGNREVLYALANAFNSAQCAVMRTSLPEGPRSPRAMYQTEMRAYLDMATFDEAFLPFVGEFGQQHANTPVPGRIGGAADAGTLKQVINQTEYYQKGLKKTGRLESFKLVAEDLLRKYPLNQSLKAFLKALRPSGKDEELDSWLG